MGKIVFCCMVLLCLSTIEGRNANYELSLNNSSESTEKTNLKLNEEGNGRSESSCIGTKEEEHKCINTCDAEIKFHSIIGQSFISSSTIKTLKLVNSDITELNEFMFRLPNLENLDLSNNQLYTERFFSFGEITNLKTLILNGNKNKHKLIESSSLEYDHDDEDYDHDDNDYSSPTKIDKSNFEVIYNYPNIEFLSLRDTDIASIPSNFQAKLPKLNNLDISENKNLDIDNLFTNMPSTITTLSIDYSDLQKINHQIPSNVTILNLNHNNFKILTNDIYQLGDILYLGNLIDLQYLSVHNCDIKQIEMDAFKDTGNLVYLDLSYNDFTKISPGTLNNVPLLTTLNISGTPLTSIPDISTTPNLFTLVMDSMRNQNIFESIPSFSKTPVLENLRLRSNQLTTVPVDLLNKLPNLRQLDLSDNHIKIMPPWKELHNIQILNLRSNWISDIEDISLNEAKSLKFLNLKSNHDIKIKSNFFKYLPDDVVIAF